MSINPHVLAEVLIGELIQGGRCPIPAEVCIPSAAAPAIESKVKLYQFTSILLGVMTAAKAKPSFRHVQEHLEQLFFSAEMDADLLLDVRAAMNNISKIITFKKEDRGMMIPWARDWLLTVGIEEANPITLCLLAWYWMDYYIMVSDSLKSFDPEEILATS